MENKPSIALIGAGNMGGAMLAGWLARGAIEPRRSAVFDPKPSKQLAALSAAHRLALNPDKEGLSVDCVVVAIKPQIASDILPAYISVCDGAIVLSIMAGCSIARLSSLLGGHAKVARAMPNLPAAIEKGASGVYAPPIFSKAQRATVDALLAAAGDVVWLENEVDVDFVTAVSGSGPAYFFLLAEALADAGVALGLEEAAAQKLARATLFGAGAFVQHDERTLAELRAAVTSPGGTTAAALDIFDGASHDMRNLVRRAVEAAARRAAELTQ